MSRDYLFTLSFSSIFFDLPRDAKYVEDNDDKGHDTKDLAEAGSGLNVVWVDRCRRLRGRLLLAHLSPEESVVLSCVSTKQPQSAMGLKYADKKLEHKLMQISGHFMES